MVDLVVIGLGLEPAPQVLLHPSVIERFAGQCRVLTVSTGADEQAPSNQQDHQQGPRRDHWAGACARDPLRDSAYAPR